MNTPPGSAESIFERALECEAGPSRDRFIEQAAAGHAGLLHEVRTLLSAHDRAGGFLEPPPAVANALAGSTLDGRASPGPLGHPPPPQMLAEETAERVKAARRVLLFGLSGPPRLESQVQDADQLPQVPGYRILHRLGSGSLGHVYAADDLKLRRRVAIKILRPQPDTLVRQRLVAEARKAAALSDPGVVTVFAVLDENDPPAIVMELVEGFPLDHFASRLTFDQKARLLRETARALAAAHARGLIHRDLKPDNIIVGPDMRPRIVDFGLALSLEEAARQGAGFEGTPLYASPEQVRGAALGPPSDIFSYGSLMFKVLTGRPPFAGTTVAEVFQSIATTPPPMLRDVAVGVPEDLQAICLACLAWNPADRPAASEIVLELGRFLVGEPVRLRPRLYGDLLRSGVSEHSHQARTWESQGVISRDERDSLEVVHRRLLTDEDHWIIDARRITPLQTLLSGGSWLAVVATVLTVWLLRSELGSPWRWLLPTGFTLALLGAGFLARRARDDLALATFLAGAALAIAPSVLALLGELGLFARVPGHVAQLFPGDFSNEQVFAASLSALAVSALAWWRLKLTGFAWTTAALTLTSYLAFLLLFNWLDREPEIRALWCLPLVTVEFVALRLERIGRVRWTLPFHLTAFVALVLGLDVMAESGPTLQLLGFDDSWWQYLDHTRLRAFSFAGNGLVFLVLAFLTQRASSLDLRRGSRLLEILAIVHLLGALFTNAVDHRDAAHVRLDVWLYLAAALLFLVLAPFWSRWRMLAGGLAGCGLGSYLLVDLGLVARKPFVIAIGCIGLLVALGTFAFVARASRRRARFKTPPLPPPPLPRSPALSDSPPAG